jgi:ketosteroid isomerase-like protein
MFRPLSLTAAFGLLALAACQPSKPVPLSAADSTAINKLRTDYMAGWNAGKVDALVALYTSAAELQVPDKPAVKGSDALRSYFNGALGTPTRPTVDIRSTMMMGRQDLAVGVGTFTMTPPAPPAPAKGAEPAPPPPVAGKYIDALTKQADGSWKIAFHAISFDAPPVAPAPPKPQRKGRR